MVNGTRFFWLPFRLTLAISAAPLLAPLPLAAQQNPAPPPLSQDAQTKIKAGQKARADAQTASDAAKSALNDAKALLDATKDLRIKADNVTADINRFSDFPDDPVTLSDHLSKVQQAVKSSGTDALLKNLQDIALPASKFATLQAHLKDATPTGLTKPFADAKTALQTAKSDLAAIANPTAEITAEIAACAAMLDALTAQQTSITAMTDTLDKAAAQAKSSADNLQKAYTDTDGKFKKYADALNKRLTNLTSLNAPTASTLLETLSQELVTLRGALALKKSAFNVWKGLQPELAALATQPPADTATAAFNAFDASAVKIEGNQSGWLKAITDELSADEKEMSGKVQDTIQDPLKNSQTASGLVSSAAHTLAQAAFIADTLTGIQQDIRPDYPESADKLVGTVKSLRAATENLRSTMTKLKEALQGNLSNFVADQISLYYFTDVRRLMNVLKGVENVHEEGGSQDASREAKAQRDNLNRADIDLTNAQTELSNDRRRVQELREQLRQAQAAFDSSDNLLKNASRRLLDRQKAQTKAQTKLTDAQTAAQLASNDPVKKAAADAAQTAKDKADEDVTHADQMNTDAQADRNKAKDTLDGLKNENNSLPDKIKDAENNAARANGEVTRLRTAALQTAQTEVAAFAAARDNASFLTAPAIAASTDPAQRVQMYAFEDSKTIFLRGQPDDVNRVKDIVARFDQPVPQARLTLWTLELNSDGSHEGAKKFNNALHTVNEQLANHRAQIAACVSLLRDCINAEVQNTQAPMLASWALGTDTEYERRLTFYACSFLDPDHGPRRLLRLTKSDLPDPAATTTLGESLMVLSMATHDHLQHILCSFKAKLANKEHMFGAVKTFGNRKLAAAGAQAGHYPSPDQGVWFASLCRALGCFPDGTPASTSVSPAQAEIIRALKRVAWEHTIDQLNYYGKRLVMTLKRKRDLDDQLKQGPNEALGAEFTAQGVEENLVKNQLVEFLNKPGLFSAAELASYSGLLSAKDTPTIQVLLDGVLSSLQSQYPADETNARVAAADQMLKELVIAVEDDLERYFVEPMLDELRATLLREKIGVGVLQRTTTLASNRLVARVDPRGSGQLALGEEQNALQATQQLAQLYLASQTAGLSGVLGGLNALPHDTPPSLYGVTTGNVFQVTPVIDPSGQALRFRFDYVYTNQIREPDDTVDPQLPRIERHSVNTEVQLSNLELRNISQFDANVRLGLSTRRSGGVPILKDIPGFSDIPLIGWFAKRSGRAALIQQNLIFAQTAIYPTIRDITNLLSGNYAPDKSETGTAPQPVTPKP